MTPFFFFTNPFFFSQRSFFLTSEFQFDIPLLPSSKSLRPNHPPRPSFFSLSITLFPLRPRYHIFSPTNSLAHGLCPYHAHPLFQRPLWLILLVRTVVFCSTSSLRPPIQLRDFLPIFAQAIFKSVSPNNSPPISLFSPPGPCFHVPRLFHTVIVSSTSVRFSLPPPFFPSTLTPQPTPVSPLTPTNPKPGTRLGPPPIFTPVSLGITRTPLFISGLLLSESPLLLLSLSLAHGDDGYCIFILVFFHPLWG